MRVALIVTTWGRPDLTDVVFNHYRTMKTAGLSLVRFAAISPEDPFLGRLTSAAIVNGFHHVLVANRPLAKKHNLLLRAARLCDPDAILHIGSDDVVNLRYIKRSVEALAGADYSYPEQIHFYDIPSGRLIRRSLDKTGIRMFSRAAVDRMDWHLWDAPTHSLAMDSAMDRRLNNQLSGAAVTDPLAVVMDIKDGSTHRISFLQYEHNTVRTELDAERFLRSTFPLLAEPLRALRRGPVVGPPARHA